MMVSSRTERGVFDVEGKFVAAAVGRPDGFAAENEYIVRVTGDLTFNEVAAVDTAGARADTGLVTCGVVT